MATSVTTPAWFAALVAFVTAATFVAPRAASADEPDGAPAPTERLWYGGPMVAADVASISLLVGVEAMEDGDASPVLGTLGILGAVAFAPIDHLAHDHGKRAIGSLAMRVGLPFIGFLLAAGSCEVGDGSGESCDTAGQNGAILGLFTAVVLDDLLLAYDERPAAGASSGLQLGLAPRGEGGFTASVGATF